VLAELARRDLVPAIWLPDPLVRAERERARWRLHLVRHRSSLKQRVHGVLLTHGKPCRSPTCFGVRGRQLLAQLGLPEPSQETIEASLRLIDERWPGSLHKATTSPQSRAPSASLASRRTPQPTASS
jgi:transposase